MNYFITLILVVLFFGCTPNSYAPELAELSGQYQKEPTKNISNHIVDIITKIVEDRKEIVPVSVSRYYPGRLDDRISLPAGQEET